jgi:hypothetical protein
MELDFHPKPIMAELLALLLSLLCIIRTKVGAVCTIPVPSSIVTKSPEITLKAFSGFDKAMRMAIARNESQLQPCILQGSGMEFSYLLLYNFQNQ